MKLQVCFQITDITKQDYDDESFDVIYSRDTLLHIGDKDTLFANFYVSFASFLSTRTNN